MLLAQALEIADRVLNYLDGQCSRASIAGSIRRQRPEVKDIEICVVPREGGFNMWGDVQLVNIDVGGLGKLLKNGPKYKQIALPEGINLDLFIVTPPAQWGVIFALRTGPAEFSKLLVTSRRYGGYLPSWARVKNGAVWSKGQVIDMPEERDFFYLCGIDPPLLPEYREKYILTIPGLNEWPNTRSNR